MVQQNLSHLVNVKFRLGEFTFRNVMIGQCFSFGLLWCSNVTQGRNDSVRFLGLQLDNLLAWKSHTEKL
jgi:hypothetical protein